MEHVCNSTTPRGFDRVIGDDLSTNVEQVGNSTAPRFQLSLLQISVSGTYLQLGHRRDSEPDIQVMLVGCAIRPMRTLQHIKRSHIKKD